MAKGTGYIFQDEIQTSANEQNVWFFRVKDVNIPNELRKRIRVSENPYDALTFKRGYLFPLELKSSKGATLPFKNIKDHQTESLIKSNTYEDEIIPGFLINFSEHNRSFFLHIEEFQEYVTAAESGVKIHKDRKVNKSSLSMDYCEGFAVELKGVKKVKRYRWFIADLLDELIDRYTVWENRI